MTTSKSFGGAFEGRSVLLTGHTGFKGAWLAHWLHALGAKVTGVALPPATERSLFDSTGLESELDHVVQDIRDAEAMSSLVERTRPDFVFHLAAQALVLPSYDDPVDTFSTNAMGTAHVLDAVRRRGEPCSVVVVTTDKCYENREWEFAYREDDPMGGHDPYSASKGVAELITSSYRRSFFPEGSGIRVASARAGNVVGPGDWAAHRLVPDVIRALLSGDPVEIRSPQSTRPWQHVLEPLSGYLWLGAALAGDEGPRFTKAYNLGPAPESSRTVGELVQLLHTTIGRGAVELGQPPAGRHEAQLLRLAIDRVASDLGWRPTWDFERTIEFTARGYHRLDEAKDAAEATAVVRGQIDAYSRAAAELGQPWAQGTSE